MSGQAGFTLIETLVALMLVGLLTALCTSLLSMTNRMTDESIALERRTAELDRMHDFIRDLVESAQRQSDLLDGAAGLPPQRLDSAHLDLVTSLPPGLGKGGLSLVTLSVAKEARTQSLSLRIQSLRPDGPEPAKGLLIGDAERISWSYFDAQAGTWTDQWTKPDLLPDLVRLDVETAQTGRWPPLIAAPRLGGGIFCVYDAAAGSCRTGKS